MVFLRTAGLLLLLAVASPVAGVRRVGRQPAAPGTTPVKKVIELLKKLSAQVEEDGKREAAAYDKYACFCKEQADNKLYAIEKSEKLIASLSAELFKLMADIADLGAGISSLTTKISGLDSAISSATSARQGQHEAYLAKEADTSAGIDAIKRAIAALQDSKGDMSGKVAFEKASATLAQLSAAAAKALGQQAKKNLQPGEEYDYEYHSNDIIAILEKLLVTFTETKNRLDQEEFEANSAFEKAKLGMQNEKKFAEKEKLAKEKMEAEKTERLQAAQQEKLAEEGARDSDKAFMQTLTSNCEDKAKEWDSRSQTRAQEITAISKATEALETGVAPNWKANRMLVGLPQKKSQAPPAFLQLRGSERGAQQRRKVLALLRASAEQLHSPALSVAALRVQASEDHFEKVRSIIKDIVSRLEAQAAAEATTKGYCDTEMAKAVSLRDAKNQEIESLTAQITEKEVLKARTQGEIAALSSAIADNMKAQKEATELRADEKKDNTNVMTDAKAGKAAVEYALQVLKQFYDGQGVFVQTSAGYVPPNSDRSGKTVEDLAPETFESGYDGRQQASKGIIGLLEVILADFDRTHTTVDAAEATSAGEFQMFETAIEADTNQKTGDKATKEGEVTNLDDDLVQLQDQKKDAVKAHDLAISTLDGLKAMCVEGEETYEERVAKREKEIAALKEAHDILENWQA